jgi:hypothetical protein
MSRLAVLQKRRELLLLSADLQRAAIQAELDRIQARPGRALLASLWRFARRRWLRAVALGVASFVFRKSRRAS